MHDEMPYLQSGQGRDDDHIEDDGMALAFYLVVAVILVIGAAAYALFR